MNKIITTFLLTALLAFGIKTAKSQTLKVNGTALTYNMCDTILLRGVNLGAYWLYDVYNRNTFNRYLDEIKKTNSNCVRIVWSEEAKYQRTPAVLDSIINQVISRKMIPIIENHDYTCADFSTNPIKKATNYWLRADVLPILKKYNKYLILNIANEVGAWTGESTAITKTKAVNAYQPEIIRIRRAGITCPLMIDAPFCGQNIEALVAMAPELKTADSLKNVLFSFHAYWDDMNTNTPVNTASYYQTRLQNAYNTAKQQNICLFMGEFSVAQSCETTAKTNQYQTLMQVCNANKIGYAAWEWTAATQWGMYGQCPPDNRGYARLSMTDASGSFSSLRDWSLIIGNDIKNTATLNRFFTNPCSPTTSNNNTTTSSIKLDIFCKKSTSGATSVQDVLTGRNNTYTLSFNFIVTNETNMIKYQLQTKCEGSNKFSTLETFNALNTGKNYNHKISLKAKYFNPKCEYRVVGINNKGNEIYSNTVQTPICF